MTTPDYPLPELASSLLETPPYSPPAPLSFGEKLERLPFPVDALGDELKTYILALQQVTQAPIEICFAALFSAMNHAAQALANVQLPQGQVKPLSCFFITIADSGERKTRADDDALKITAQYQDELLASYAKAQKVYKNLRAVYEETKKSLFQDKDAKSLSLDEKTKLLETLQEPIQPPKPLLVTADPTMEGLIKLFYNGYPFVMLSTSEGGEFFGSHANTKENHLKTLAKLSRLWDGAPIDQVRKDSELLFLKDQRLNLHISVQLTVFESFMGQGIAEGQGFLSRVLLSAPKPLAGTRPWVKPDQAKNHLQTLAPFYAKVATLYQSIAFNEEDPLRENPQGNPASGLKLRNISCEEEEALALLENFYAYGESKIGLGGVFHDIKDFVSKAIENTLRIAATLTLFENPTASTITLDTLQTAIEIVNFYMSEHLFIRSSGEESNEALLLTWLYKKYPDGVFDRRTVLQRAPQKFRKAASLDAVLQTLEDAGYLKPSLTKGQYRLVPLPSLTSKGLTR